MANGKRGAPMGNKNAAGGGRAANFVNGLSKGVALRAKGATAGFTNGGRGVAAGAATRGAVGGASKGAIVGGLVGGLIGGTGTSTAIGAAVGAGAAGVVKGMYRHSQAKQAVAFGQNLQKTVSKHDIASVNSNIRTYAHTPNSAISKNSLKRK